MTLLGALMDAYAKFLPRGPFAVDPAGGFVPSGATWDALLALVTANGGTPYAYKAYGPALRQTTAVEPGISAGQSVGGIENWFAPGLETAAKTDVAEQRPVFASVGGINAVQYDGDVTTTTSGDRHALPHIAGPRVLMVAVVRGTHDTVREHTAVQVGPFRLVTRSNAADLPAVRTGGGVYGAFTGASSLDAWHLYMIEVDTGSTSYRIRRNGQAWQTVTASSGWMSAFNTTSWIGVNTYEPTNFDAGDFALHSLFIWNVTALTTAQLQTIVDWCQEGTGINDTVPATVPPEPAPDAWNAVGAINIDALAVTGVTRTVSNGTDLTNALNAANPGDHIVLQNGTYSGSWAISRAGTQASPIVIRSASGFGGNITGTLTLSGAWVIASRLTCSQISLLAPDCRASRCYLSSRIFSNAPATRCTIDYCKVTNPPGRGIELRPTTSSTTMMNMWVHRCWVTGQVATNKSSINMTAGSWEATRKNHNLKISYCLAENGNGSTTIGSKASGSIIEYCTLRNNPNAGISGPRHGTDCIIRGNSMFNSRGIMTWGKGHTIIGNYTDVTSPSNWGAHGGGWGNCTSDNILDLIAIVGVNEGTVYERAENCLWVGNIGALTLGAGNSSFSPNPLGNFPALNNEIRAHTGSISLLSGRQTGTIDNRNAPAGITVPAYVSLTSADVGPLAP